LANGISSKEIIANTINTTPKAIRSHDEPEKAGIIRTVT
jgi:hypothetical protein